MAGFWPDMLREAARTQQWELRIRQVAGEGAQRLIDEAHRKAVSSGGAIADRLAEAYADWLEVAP